MTSLSHRDLSISSFIYLFNPRFVYQKLPQLSKTENTRFRWWQPKHGVFGDQWALDDVYIGNEFSAAVGDNTYAQVGVISTCPGTHL